MSGLVEGLSSHPGVQSADMSVLPTLTADRLYGIQIRPQELALYGENAQFSLRYGITNEEPDQATVEHFKLVVLEITALAPADEDLGIAERQLDLLKCGWELEFSTPSPVMVGDLSEAESELEYALSQIADTVNELSRRAGLEAPLGAELIAELVNRYRKPLAP